MNRDVLFRSGLALTLLLLLAVALSPAATAADDSSEEFEAGGFALFGAICLTMCFVMLVIAIFLGVWIYKDAEKRGKDGGLWVVILLLGTLFLNFIGTIIVIVIWLMVRPPELPPDRGQYRDYPQPRDRDRDYPPPRGYERDYPPPRGRDRDYPPPRGYDDRDRPPRGYDDRDRPPRR